MTPKRESYGKLGRGNLTSDQHYSSVILKLNDAAFLHEYNAAAIKGSMYDGA